MFKKKCQSLDHLTPLKSTKYKKSDHFHYHPNYHFHIPPTKQKHLRKNVRRSTSQSNTSNNSFTANVQHSSSTNSAHWKINENKNYHDSDLSIHSSLSNQSNLSSISVNSSNFLNNSLVNSNGQILSSSGLNSTPSGNLYQNYSLYHHKKDKNRFFKQTNQNFGDYENNQPTPPPLPRYSSYNSVTSHPFHSNLTTPVTGSLHLTASQISLEFNAWYNALQIHCGEEQQKLARKSVREWVRTQPLSILQLDSADREVLKIAGRNFFCFKF